MIKLSPFAPTPYCAPALEVDGLYFVKAPGDKFLSIYVRYKHSTCWIPMHIGIPALQTFQQVRDTDRNISINSGSYDNAHFYLRSAEGNNMTAAYYTNGDGGAVQVGDTEGYAPLNLQPEGGLLTYNGLEVATKDWVSGPGTPGLQEVTNAGNTTTNNVSINGQLSIGVTSPSTFNASSTFFPGVTPKVELRTGSGPLDSYNEAVVIRHQGTTSVAGVRELGLVFKMNHENSAEESQKMGAITTRSEAAFANNPNMLFYVGASEKMRILNSGIVTINSLSGTGSRMVIADSGGSLSTQTIPTVNNGVLTLSTSGIATGSASFTANQAGNSTFTVNVPGTNLGPGSDYGSITSSTGTGVTISSISRVTIADGNEIPTSAGLVGTFNTTGSTNYPATSGGGIKFSRSAGATTNGNFAIWKNNTNDGELYFRVGLSGSDWGTWVKFASKEWVNSIVGSPATLSPATTNTVTGGSHTHAITNVASTASYTMGNMTTNTGALDANLVPYTGFVYAGTGGGASTNLPGSYGNGHLISSINAGGASVQLYLNSTIANDEFYFRRANSGTWQSWYQVASRQWVLAQGYTTNVGTVTSVGASISGALSVSGSPITGAGTIAFSWTGSSGQYVRGDGTLATFPSITTPNLQAVTTVGATTTNEVQFTNTVFFPGSGAQFFANGTGDGASYSTYNMKVHGHWSWAFEDHTNTIRGLLDFRTGILDMQGGFTTAGMVNAATARITGLIGSGTRMVTAGADGTLATAAIPAYTGSTSITLSGTSFQRAALTGDVTAAANSNATTIANNAVTLAKMADVATNSILGRYSAGTGDPQVVTVGEGLAFSSTSLTTKVSHRSGAITMPLSVAAFSAATINISVPGAALGMPADIYLDNSIAAAAAPLICKAVVSAANTVTVHVFNASNGNITLASAPYKAVAWILE